MSTHNICFHEEIIKYYVDTPSYLGLYKPSSIMPTTCLQSSHMGPPIFPVISFLYGILLIFHDLCDLVHVTQFACWCRKITKF